MEQTRSRFRSGVRAGLPFAIAGLLVSTSFGVIAVAAGMTTLQAVLMSLVVFAGSAQFTAVSIVAAGGSIGAAVIAAAMMNSRFLPMGVALAPSLPGGALARAMQGQTVVDASWAMALRDDGRFDRLFLFGATAPQYVTWALGTLAGALAGDALGDTDRFGFDAVFPAFFLALLVTEASHHRARAVALGGAAVALALVSFTPAGVPVLAASTAALVGARVGRG